MKLYTCACTTTSTLAIPSVPGDNKCASRMQHLASSISFRRSQATSKRASKATHSQATPSTPSVHTGPNLFHSICAVCCASLEQVAPTRTAQRSPNVLELLHRQCGTRGGWCGYHVQTLRGVVRWANDRMVHQVHVPRLLDGLAARRGAFLGPARVLARHEAPMRFLRSMCLLHSDTLT